MNEFGRAEDPDIRAVFKSIKQSDQSDVDKLAQAFEWVTGRYIENGEHEIELARAMGDQEALIKEQIKLSMMKHARGIFEDCYRIVTGRMGWDE